MSLEAQLILGCMMLNTVLTAWALFAVLRGNRPKRRARKGAEPFSHGN